MTPNREQLQFPVLVRQAFEFLETDYGFTCCEENETYVRYEANGVFVSVYHGRRSYEVGIEIGLEEIHLNSGFGIGTLISIYSENNDKKRYYKIASSVDKIKEFLSELSCLLKKYGDQALRGDKAVFILMKRKMDEYWGRMRADQIRIKASEAFKKRDYKKATSLYESMSDFLAESERKKLEYARKKSV